MPVVLYNTTEGLRNVFLNKVEIGVLGFLKHAKQIPLVDQLRPIATLAMPSAPLKTLD